MENRNIIDTPTIKFTPDNRILLITKEKIQILDRPEKYTIWIGGKDAGKTRPVQVQQIWDMQKNNYNSSFTMKRHKNDTVTKINRNLQNLLRAAKRKGFNPPEYRYSQGMTYKYTNKKQTIENQSIGYLSFDDPDSHTNLGAYDNGVVPTVHLEEMVPKKPKNMPTEQQFWAEMETLNSNVQRMNREAAMLRGIPEVQSKYHITINAWDEGSPLVIISERHHPEIKFMEWVLGQPLDSIDGDSDWDQIWKNIQENHTKAVTVPEKDLLIVRLTSFANPEFELDELTKSKIKEALINKDTAYLAVRLGLTRTEPLNDVTYDLNNWDNAEYEEFEKHGWRAVSASTAMDVDINRGLFLTTTYLMKRHKEYYLFVDEQKYKKCWGSGKNGKNMTKYVEFSKELIDAEQKLIMVRVGINPELPYSLWIDEDKGWFMHVLENFPMIYTMAKAKKHGAWDIKPRESWLNGAIAMEKISFHKDNTILYRNLKQSYLRKDLSQRDESGGLAKNYDRINSMEYSIWPFRNQISIRK